MEFIKYILRGLVYGGSVFFDLAKWLIIILVVLSIVNTFFVAIFVVSGSSMDPNFKNKELIIWNKNIYQKNNPKRGDIVVVNSPVDPKAKYVKRVVGLPNETVSIKEGKVFINGKQIQEIYLPVGLTSEPDGVWKVKSNEYFVMGDNRPNSNDSRYFGPVPKRFVLGKSIAVIFPRFRLTEDI